MHLTVLIDEQSIDLKVPDELVIGSEPFFARMDKDMDAGWQMSRDWVEQPDRIQRCQITADKLLTSIENENQKLATMMAGYILARLPGVQSVEIDTSGEISETRFEVRESRPSEADSAAPPAPAPGGMSKLDALDQAGKDVSKVFKAGRHYRFSVYDHAGGRWQDSPVVAEKQEAERLREQAFKQRFDQLVGGR